MTLFISSRNEDAFYKRTIDIVESFCVFALFIMEMKLSIDIAGMVSISTVPREPNSIETLVIASLLGASTMFTKS
jgi:hypothetical protein